MEPVQHPLNLIGKIFEPIPAAEQPPPVYTGSGLKDQLSEPEKDRRLSNPACIPRSLSLAGLKLPALMLDSQSRVTWQNRMAVDQIWRNAHTASNGNPTPLIFDLLFDAQFRHVVENWRHWVSFFIKHLIDFMPKETVQHRIDQMQLDQRSTVSALAERILSDPNQATAPVSRLRQTLKDGEITVFNSVSIDFDEGRLVTFEPVTFERNSGPVLHLDHIEQSFAMIARQPNSVNVPYTVLCASLNHSRSLKTELLSLEYSNLIKDLCNRAIAIVERFGGIFARHSDNGFSAHFLPADEYGDEHCMNAIQCALELRAQMAEVSREWKIRKAWHHELALNIGIHHEEEYAGILTTTLGDCLTSYGSALGIASDLARLAQDGQIWITKALINEMPAPVRNQLRFGIPRPNSHTRQLILQNGFARMQDLTGLTAPAGEIFSAVGEVVVTQLFENKLND